jgi:hypothetical protein
LRIKISRGTSVLRGCSHLRSLAFFLHHNKKTNEDIRLNIRENFLLFLAERDEK